MTNAEVIQGDCIEVMRGMGAESVDAIVTDPPYGLEFMGKEWDQFKPAGARIRIANERDMERGAEQDGLTTRLRNKPEQYSAGAPFQSWCEQWATEALRVLKPGGHLLAFGGTRTYHRMVCAIEDAGFEIRDSIHWIYGSGFPKSHNLHDEWEGWGTALKPAHEPVVVARKPLIGTVAQNVLEYGTGALNIDGCRVATTDSLGGGAEKRVAVEGKHEGWQRPWMRDSGAVEAHAARIRENVQHAEALGRWPANIILSHTPDCSDECAEDCPVAEMDRQSGKRTSGYMAAGQQRNKSRGLGGYGDGFPDEASATGTYGDSGGASRFFPIFRYEAKASRKDRGEGNTHPTVKPVALMRWLVRLITPPGGTVLDPFAGSGTTLVAALEEGFSSLGIEREPEYIDIINRRLFTEISLPLDFGEAS